MNRLCGFFFELFVTQLSCFSLQLTKQHIINIDNHGQHPESIWVFLLEHAINPTLPKSKPIKNLSYLFKQLRYYLTVFRASY